jgi:hypothetical protein
MNKNIRHKIGDRVVALTNPPSDRSQFRVKGQIYKVVDVSYCSKCGNQTINIGQQTNCVNFECDCGFTSPTNGLHWTNSYLFVKVDDIEDTLTEAINNEDYELASILRDVEK